MSQYGINLKSVGGIELMYFKTLRPKSSKVLGIEVSGLGAGLFFLTPIFTAIFTIAISTAAAQPDPESPEELKAELIKLYCAHEGRLTRCVGLSGRDCPEIVTPFIEGCFKRLEAPTPAGRALEMYSCFSGDFYKQYGSRIEKSEECIRPAVSPDAIKPLPPELAKKAKPYRP